MAITRTGSAGTISTTLNSGSSSISVPTDATLIVVGVAGYVSDDAFISGGTLTLGGQSLSIGHNENDVSGGDRTAVWYKVNPLTGTQTLAWNWAGSNNWSDGGNIYYAFYKGVDTVSPVKDHKGNIAEQVASASTLATASMTAASGDMVFASLYSYDDPVNPTSITWTNASELAGAIQGASRGDIAEGFPSGNVIVTADPNGNSDANLWMTLAAVVFKFGATSSLIAGTASVAITISATLIGIGELVGTSNPIFSNSAVLVGKGELVGQSDIVVSISANLIPRTFISGSSNIAFTTLANLVGIGELVGQSDIAVTNAGDLVGKGQLIGTANAVISTSASLQANGQLAGQSDIVGSTEAFIFGIGIGLNGLSHITTNIGGILGGRGDLISSSAIQFLTNAILFDAHASANLAGESSIIFITDALINWKFRVKHITAKIMATLINGSDFLDEIDITDENGDLVNITDLPGFRVIYYTNLNDTIIKFSKDGESDYLPFTIVDDYHYRAYIEDLTFKPGKLKSDVYIATTNNDLDKGNFINLGTKEFDINIVDRPITALL